MGQVVILGFTGLICYFSLHTWLAQMPSYVREGFPEKLISVVVQAPFVELAKIAAARAARRWLPRKCYTLLMYVLVPAAGLGMAFWWVWWGVTAGGIEPLEWHDEMVSAFRTTLCFGR